MASLRSVSLPGVFLSQTDRGTIPLTLVDMNRTFVKAHEPSVNLVVVRRGHWIQTALGSPLHSMRSIYNYLAATRADRCAALHPCLPTMGQGATDFSPQ